MSDLRDAARQALEALEGGGDSWRMIGPAIDALKAALTEEALQRLTDLHQEIEAALEQPEQPEQPVAWCDIEEDGYIHGLRYWSEPGRREHALYTHPPRREWRGLTDEQLLYVYNELPNWGMDMDSLSPKLKQFARAIEAALKERNA